MPANIFGIENLNLLEHLNWPYYHDEKCKLKQDKSHAFTWKFKLPLYSRFEIFAKICHFCWTELKNCPCYYELKFFLKKQFWWCYLNFWTGPIIKSWKFFAKIGSFDDVTQKFDLPLLSQAEIFHKINWTENKLWTGLIITR